MLLAQLSTIKNRLGITDTTDDTLLTNFIEFASARFERDTNRSLDRVVSTTEEFPADSTEIVVARFPLESVSSFHLKENESDGWVLQNDVDYLRAEPASSWPRQHPLSFRVQPRSLRCTRRTASSLGNRSVRKAPEVAFRPASAEFLADSSAGICP